MMMLSKAATRTTALLVLAALSLCLGGCSSAEPFFRTPIEWGEGERQPLGADLGEDIETVATTVTLLGEGRAALSEFPQGESKEASNGSLCLQTSDAPPFTGDAVWKNIDGGTIALEFDDSNVSVSALSGRFGDQDWTQMVFVECGGKKLLWRLTYVCGIPGYGGPGKKFDSSDEPCTEGPAPGAAPEGRFASKGVSPSVSAIPE